MTIFCLKGQNLPAIGRNREAIQSGSADAAIREDGKTAIAWHNRIPQQFLQMDLSLRDRERLLYPNVNVFEQHPDPKR